MWHKYPKQSSDKSTIAHENKKIIENTNMAGLFEVNSKKSECLIKPNWSLITLK